MQKVKANYKMSDGSKDKNGTSQVTDGQTVGGDCITSRANAVGNKSCDWV